MNDINNYLSIAKDLDNLTSDNINIAGHCLNYSAYVNVFNTCNTPLTLATTIMSFLQMTKLLQLRKMER